MNKWKFTLLNIEHTDRSFSISIGVLGYRIPKKKRTGLYNWTNWYLFSISFWNKKLHGIIFNYRINYPKSQQDGSK
jgi:hypothetical protein